MGKPNDRPKTLSEEIPQTMRAVVLYRDEDKDLLEISDESKRLDAAIHVEKNIPVPVPGYGEVLVKVMAGALNFNTLWALKRKPVSTFDRLGRFARLDPDAVRHNLDYQILGSDGAGVVVKVGEGVHNCSPGDHVVIHPVVFNQHSPAALEDYLYDDQSRIWGYETNFGSFAEYCLVRETQILPKPRHLSWAESAVLTGANATVYRMLISPNGARLSIGETVLIWGASGGIGSLAIQYVLKAGGIPIAVVSTEEKADLVRSLGCHSVLIRSNQENSFISPDGTPDMRQLIRFRKDVFKLSAGQAPDIVFEHPGSSTFYASVFIAANKGRIVTCGSTTGYQHTYDNRYFWMYGKRIIGSHCASWSEASRANDLVCRGIIIPELSGVFPLENFRDAVYAMNTNHVGKIALLCNANSIDEGIEDFKLRNEIGEKHFRLFLKKIDS